MVGRHPSCRRPCRAGAREKASCLRVVTRLVQVNVVVLDNHKQAVEGLTKDDFRILDGGRPQQISVFRVDINQPAVAPGPKLPRGIYTNGLGSRAQALRNVTAVLLDGLNTRTQDQAYARAQIMKFLERLPPGDHIALYALGSDLRVLHDFTTDNRALLRVLAKLNGTISNVLDGSEPEPADSGDDQLDSILNDMTSREAEFFTTLRVQMTARAIAAIARHLADIPGRKSLIWVSGGFPEIFGLEPATTSQGFTRQQGPGPRTGPFDLLRTYGGDIDQMIREVNQVNLAIYPVDARGLTPPAMFSAQRRTINMRNINPITPNLETMNELAERTGGAAYYNTNDIAGAVRDVLEQSRVTYVLGYYPDHNDWKGEERKIKVQVGRSGLQLRYRHSYIAFPDEPEAPAAAPLETVAFGHLDASALGLTVRAALGPISPGSTSADRTLMYQLLVWPGGLSFHEDGGRWVASVTVLELQLSPEGKNLRGVTKTMQLHLKRETYAQIEREGFAFADRLARVRGAVRFCLVVRDDPSGALGSVTVPLAQLASSKPN